MKNAIKAALLAALACCSSGCVTMMKKEAFEGPIVSAGDNCNRAHDDLALKSGIYNEVVKKSSTPKAEPYPELGSLIARMNAAFDKANQDRISLVPLSKKFDELRQGRPDISSDRPQWEPFMKLYDEMKVTIPRLSGELQEYSTASNRFSELANQFQIGKVNLTEIRGKLSGQLDSLEKATADIRRQLRDMDAKLLEHTIQTMGIQQHKDLHAIIATIRSLATQLDEAGASMKGKVKAFEDATKGMSELWRGPGFPKIEIAEQIAKDSQAINSLVGQVNGEAAKWNALVKN